MFDVTVDPHILPVVETNQKETGYEIIVVINNFISLNETYFSHRSTSLKLQHVINIPSNASSFPQSA